MRFVGERCSQGDKADRVRAGKSVHLLPICLVRCQELLRKSGEVWDRRSRAPVPKPWWCDGRASASCCSA